MITHKKLLETLHYDPDSGEFTWIKNTGLKDLVGKKAGSINSLGYVNMSLLGKRYSGHRLAWFYCFEEWPEFNIDHIDGNHKNEDVLNLQTLCANCHRLKTYLEKDYLSK